MMADAPKLYPEQNPMELEPYFGRHMQAMTAERLDSKFAIAEQLAWRDKRIAELPSPLDLDMLEACANTLRALHESGPSASILRKLELLAQWVIVRDAARVHELTHAAPKPVPVSDAHKLTGER